MTAAFDTTTGDKQACREAFVAAVAARISRPADFFLLPSEKAHDAQLVWQHWPEARITGLECNADLFAQIRATHGRLYMQQGTIESFVHTWHHRHRDLKAPAFDAAFLDYMGPVLPGHVADICGFVAELAKPRFVLALTFLKSTRGKRATVESVFCDNAVLSEEDEFADWTVRNRADNLASAICRAIEQGYTAPRRARTPALTDRLRALDVLDARTYRANETSTAMHFIVLGIERFT